MKILVLTNKLPYPPRDGGSIATLNMLTGLSKAGNQVSCLALNTSKHRFPVDRIPGSVSGEIRIEGIPCDTSIRPAALLANLLFSREPYIASRFRSRKFRDRLVALLEEEPFDVIQLEGPYLGHYLDVIRRYSPSKVSLRAHNVEHLIWRRKADNERFPLLRLYFLNMATRLEHYELKVAANCDCLVPISPVDEAYFREKGLHMASITIPAGLDLRDYPVSPLPPGPSLFYIGALDWLPNQEGLKWFLEEVLGRLAREIPGIRLHLAGRNAPGFVERLLRHDRVTYHGEVEDAGEFIRSGRIMVAPLLTGSGIRIKILEAMALGRPVVTTPIGIEGIPAEPGRQVLVARDPESFKDHLVHLISNEEFARRIAGEGRKLIQENFDTFRLSDRLTRFFKQEL
jgi:glycosyltransferase involved in cell wall biosynthesis